jgi:hypothetical protein
MVFSRSLWPGFVAAWPKPRMLRAAYSIGAAEDGDITRSRIIERSTRHKRPSPGTRQTTIIEPQVRR